MYFSDDFLSPHIFLHHHSLYSHNSYYTAQIIYVYSSHCFNLFICRKIQLYMHTEKLEKPCYTNFFYTLHLGSVNLISAFPLLFLMTIIVRYPDSFITSISLPFRLILQWDCPSLSGFILLVICWLIG